VGSAKNHSENKVLKTVHLSTAQTGMTTTTPILKKSAFLKITGGDRLYDADRRTAS